MHNLILSLLVAVFVAASASLLGSFAILKRMALMGDALSHVALPGLALALIFGFNPFLGAVVFLLVAVTGIWFIEHRSSVPLETITGVFFTTSLAIGALLTPEHELMEALFGNISELTITESLFSVALSLILIGILLLLHKKLTLGMVSYEMARSIGIDNRRLEYIFLLSFALAVALGIRFVGALLMGSLVIIPAASARNTARGLYSFMTASVVFGVAAATIGILVSYAWSLPPGPIFIIASALIFTATFVVRQMRHA